MSLGMRIVCFLILINTFLFSEVIVVTNKYSQINSLSKNIIQYLYLEKIDTVNDTKITPLLNQDMKIHDEFVNKVLNKTILQYRSYWTRLVFTGRKSIPKQLSKQEIFLKLHSVNTIAYINKKDLRGYMKIIYEEKK